MTAFRVNIPYKARMVLQNQALSKPWENIFQSLYDITGKSKGEIAFSGNSIINKPGFSGIEFVTTNDIEFQDVEFQTKSVPDGYVATAQSSTSIAFTDPNLLPISGETGQIKFGVYTTAPNGWLLLDDGTIGNSVSGATHAGDEFENLFETLWNNVSDTYCPVTLGRGASAQVDWDVGKRLTLPQMAGRTVGSKGTGSGLTSRNNGETVGTETHTLTESEMPSHNHAFNTVSFFGTITAGFVSDNGISNNGTNYSGTIDLDDTGSDSAHNNMQPTVFYTGVIKI